MAAHGLYALGQKVLPRLHDEMGRTDDQARTLLRATVDALEGRETGRSKEIRAITTAYFAPPRGYDIQRSEVARWF